MKPKRSSHLASMTMHNKTSNKLYDDAKRRQSAKIEQVQERQIKNNRKRAKSIQASGISIKYLMKKFEGDFSKAIKSQGMGKKLNYYTTCEILKEMGFISRKEGGENNDEKVLFVDLWLSLKGDEYGGV